MINRPVFLACLLICLLMPIDLVIAQSPGTEEQNIVPNGDEAKTIEQGEAQKEDRERKIAPLPSKIDITSGDRDLICLNFIDVDIREALSALAIEREINIVTSQDVSGSISVHLYQVSLAEALDAITLAGGFEYRKQGEMYFVYKPKKEKDPQADRLQMRIFKLKYAEVNKIQEILSAFPGMRTIQIHEPTKTVIVEDTPENIRKIEKIINQWDQMPKQVMIEAKILEITLTDDMSFGVNWNDILGDARVGTGGLSTATIPTNAPVSPVPANGKGFFSNLITAAGTDSQFTAALDALQTKTRINTLSTPKILAIHGKPAKVQVGGQQGYSVTTVNDGVSTETIQFIETGTILEITPFIDDENNILLEVRPSIKSARIEGGIPVVNSTEVSTWLAARNGQTVFIGGLLQDTKNKTREMIPCLGGLPGLGPLFGRTTQGSGKSELVVLITPTILNARTDASTRKALESVEKAEKEAKEKPKSLKEQTLDFLSPVE